MKASRFILLKRIRKVCLRSVGLLFLGLALLLCTGDIAEALTAVRSQPSTVMAIPDMEQESLPEDFLDGLHSETVLLMEAETGRIWAEKNGYAFMYPASMTKIMTVLTALEQLKDLSVQFTVPDLGDYLAETGAFAVDLEPGTRISAEDLLYGSLLSSAADCVQTLACGIAGSEEEFVSLMNERAAALGLEETHFVNAVGLSDADHYSTAYEMALLFREALQNETFRSMLHTRQWQADVPELKPFLSTALYLLRSDQVPFGRIMGGKTGYTYWAGQCLATEAQIGGKRWILITAGAYDGENDGKWYHASHAKDTRTVYTRLGLYLCADQLSSEPFCRSERKIPY